jgi:hypothetical protein
MRGVSARLNRVVSRRPESLPEGLPSPYLTLRSASQASRIGQQETLGSFWSKGQSAYFLISLPTSLETEYIGASQYGYYVKIQCQ